MLGKTHLAVGVATSLIVFQPGTMSDFVLCVGAGGLGALISDIDVGTSESHKDADVVCLLALAVAGITFALEYFFHLGIYQSMTQGGSKTKMIVGALAFIAVCAFGKEQPHRSFMHSLLACVILSGCLLIVFPAAVPYFAVGFLSHICSDLFNMKKVQILYPMPGGICLGMFHACGIGNTIFFWMGLILSGIFGIMCLWRIGFY